LESKLTFPEATEVSDFEKNKAYAENLIKQFQANNSFHICLRSDFLELGQTENQRWQIFFSEPFKAFIEKVNFAFKNLALTRKVCSE
jgi:hypothetical protein